MNKLIGGAALLARAVLVIATTAQAIPGERVTSTMSSGTDSR